ncbi:hypothetical protein KC678_04730, partial [Candidatus Dojkabacteria bacterium]|nr:hypothetical protein [Candidatus Dojkabacteria bacterium]
MRILNINPKGSNFSFKVPIPALGSKLSSTQKLLEIVTSLRISFFLLMLFLLPFSPYFFSYRNLVSIDSSAFIFVVLMLLITGSFYAVEVVLSKNERVIDPNGSLIILMFGLLVTAASALLIFTDYESSANTFGLVGEYSTFKAVSGLSIIAGMATYYLTQLFAHQRSSFSGIVKALSLGFVYFELFSLFNEDYSQLISVNIVAVLFTCVGIFLFRNTLLKSATIISFIISLANILKINEFTDMRVLFMIAL